MSEIGLFGKNVHICTVYKLYCKGCHTGSAIHDRDGNHGMGIMDRDCNTQHTLVHISHETVKTID